MSIAVAADYLVVGAGATGMAFADALVSHGRARVVMVDRDHSVGGHWLHDYPFVRLHQASSFYGVASTLLGTGVLQSSGPEAGLHERATAAEICTYYQRVRQRLVDSGQVEFLLNCEYLGDHTVVSRISGVRYEVSPTARVVNAHYLAPDIPSSTPAPYEVRDGARAITVNQLVDLAAPPRRFVVVGSGKTATDTCIWLLDQGVDPDAICWVRSRDPWMIDRAGLQPDPRVYYTSAGDIMTTAARATSLEDFFLGLEEAGVMVRIDRAVVPAMAKTPTIGRWEVELLRTIGDVVRLGHLLVVAPGLLHFQRGDVHVPHDTVVVHCAASGLQYPPLVPIWGPEAITVQPVRAGFPCFGAAIAGYVESTDRDDAEKNRVCPPSPLPDTLAGWARMQVLGGRAAAAFAAEPDISEWAGRTALNPAMIPPEKAHDDGLPAAVHRFRSAVGPGLARLAELSGA